MTSYWDLFTNRCFYFYSILLDTFISDLRILFIYRKGKMVFV